MLVQNGHRRRGVILPVLLLILILLGLLAASFAFRVHADRSAMNAVAYRLHTRMAAEAGIQKVTLMLRTQRTNVTAWYNNPEELNRIIVWTPGDETVWGTNEEFEDETLAYRFSIVADSPFDDEQRCRYGITDESAKLNINTATQEQLQRLIGQIATKDMIVEQLVDALLDYRDEDDIPRENGAEADYYAGLETPYRPKNGPFDTVEELLMVKGFDGRVLYGEDQDRNGLLTPNEDDGDQTFPEDNSDGQLNRGLYPYISVHSADANTDPDNQPRIYLYGDATEVGEQLAEFIDDPAKVQFILSAIRPQAQQGDEEPEGTGGEEEPEGAGGEEAQRAEQGGAEQGAEEEGAGHSGTRVQPDRGSGRRPSRGAADQARGQDKEEVAAERRLQARPPGNRGGAQAGNQGGSQGGNQAGSQGGKQGGSQGGNQGGAQGGRQGGGQGGGRGGQQPAQGGQHGGQRPGQGRRGPGAPPPRGQSGRGGATGTPQPRGENEGPGTAGTTQPAGQEEGQGTGGVLGPGGEGATSQPVQLASPAELLTVDSGGANPLTVDDLPVLMARTTTQDPLLGRAGLINIMTAPPQVLRCLTELTGEEIGAIIAARAELSEEEQTSTAWLVTREVLSVEKYQQLAPQITAQGQQFTIESLGHADHVGTITRLQVIVEMRGPMAQILYYRDLTSLGSVYPIREGEEEYGFGGRRR